MSRKEDPHRLVAESRVLRETPVREFVRGRTNPLEVLPSSKILHSHPSARARQCAGPSQNAPRRPRIAAKGPAGGAAGE